ncbi:MAG: amino acid adenylation domain-containing protein [Halieaceae bacterium]|nr:amino acid adenylation domain-containing protein [Halieaceae bacterium]
MDSVVEVPQSFSQQRLWFIAQLAPNSALYNAITVVHLESTLDAQALQQAVYELTTRHESLRTTFDTRDGEPVQRIHPPAPFHIEVIDISDLARHARRERLRSIRQAELAGPFDLEQGPIVRFTLVILDNAEQVLLACMHHIVTDGWSMGILRRELYTLYQAFRAGQPSPLPPLTLTYADYALWQRDWMKGEVLEQRLAYWRDQLAGAERLALRAERSGGKVPRYASSQVPVHLDADLTHRLHALAREEQATLFMLLLAAFQFVLGVNAGQDDVVVATPVANRPRAELENIIGFFVNTLVLRTNLSGGLTFRNLLQHVRRTCLDAYANQDLPFERLVDDLAPQRDINTQPLAQVLFVLQNAPSPAAHSDPQRRSRAGAIRKPGDQDPSGGGFIFFDMTLSLSETTDAIRGSLHFNTQLFDPERAERLAQHFVVAVQRLALEPDRQLSSVLLIDEREADQLRRLATGSDVRSDNQVCIHALFERCVDQGPQRTALLFESHRLTYAELDQRANRLAQVLIEAGIAREQVVGVYLERGHHAIIALLAVLKAGGVYLPLNPELPADRLRMMLDDAKVGYIVTEKALRTSLPVADDATRLIDPDEVAMQTGSVARPVARTTPKHLAYIIYTSGSTGRPKGVMIEHRSVALTIASQIPLFALSEDSRVLATIALSFDASLGEIFRTLCSGATLYLARAEQVLPGPELIGLLRRQRITTCTLVTSVLAALPREPLPDLTTLSVGGEALPADVVGFWGRGRRMLNGYGPTETAIGATMATNLHPGETPPLGRPLPHIRAYVVGVDRQLVPLGAPGELWLGGPAVARGYLARPELTAEYFITDPFSSVSGARLYRTGDRVRWRSDGQLEFLGRVDEQVKIRGYRIEPGEIAKVLERHREIGKAIVVARPGRTGDLRLVAYVVPRVEQDAANNAAQALVDEWQDASDVAAKTVQATLDDPRLNFSGWTSSYTGQPIPLMEMCQWADDTVKRILSLKPTKVLEIGCGSGLILFRLAPHCRRYVGIDFAAGLLAQIKRHLALVPPTCEVELVHRRANALDGLPEKTFDCVVINSVVQYFPNLDYLLEVLQGALQRVQPGGTLFLGDIRSLPLMQVFHASVQFAKAPATMGCEGLMQRVCRLTALERELLVDPRLFAKLVTAWERVTHVRILLKDGDADNELIRFRYDVIIQLDQPPKAASEIKWIDWRWDNPQEGRAVLEALLNAAHSPLGVRHIPNARTAQSTAMLALLKEANGGQTVADLRHQLNDLPSGIGPGFFAALAETVGYHWETSWQVAAADGRFDVLLWPQQGCAAAPKFPPVDTDALDWSALANDPALASKNRDLIPQLRDFLAEQLPGYMVPAAIVVLDALPLTTHGKIDRKALPDPDAQPGSQGPAQTYVPPTNETERILSGIWADLLQVEKVGIDDNFFELGGDSILSIRIIARANEAGLTLTTQDVYRFQTVREQASAATRSDIVTADQQRITGSLALTPIQHWFFEGDNPQPQHFNWATFIRLPPGLSDADLRHALTRLIEHHDALRMRFWQDEQGTWQAHVAASIEPIPLSKVTMASAGENARRQLMAEQAELAQRSLDLAQGPIFRLLWLDDGPQQRGTGLLIVHHLVVDAISMPILVNDLNRLLRQIKAKLSLELPLKTDSIKRWSETLLEQAQSEWLDAERHFWLAPYPDDIARLPVDHPGGVNTRLSEQEETLLLSPADTEQMVRKARALETGINELTIAALALGLAHFCSQPKVLINIERHGRENIGHSLNFARTLGWFANIAPALLEVPLEREPDQILQTLLRQLRHIPNRGIGYGILRYLGDAETQQRIREQPEAEVFFNFFGQQRKRHGQAAQSITGALEKGRLRSQSGSRRHLIEINAMIQQERLQLRCSYSTNLHEPQTLRRFADAFHTAVSRLFRD